MSRQPVYDLTHLESIGTFSGTNPHHTAPALETLRLNLIHAYGYTHVNDALKNPDLWQEINDSRRDFQPTTSEVSLRALEKVRQLRNPTSDTYTNILDIVRSALTEILGWFGNLRDKKGKGTAQLVYKISVDMGPPLLLAMQKRLQLLKTQYKQLDLADFPGTSANGRKCPS